MPEEKLSPQKMFEFIKTNNKYARELSLNAQGALEYREKFNYCQGMINCLEKIGIRDEEIAEHLADYLSNAGYADNDRGREFALHSLNTARKFYEIAFSDMDEIPEGYTGRTQYLIKTQNELRLLLQAYDIALFRVNFPSTESLENLEDKI